MSFVVASSKSFDATKQAALIAAVIADCEETLVTTSAFHAADYTDTCHCKANLEHVISYINDAPAEDKFRRAVSYAETICRNEFIPPQWWQLSAKARTSRHEHKWVTTRMESFVMYIPLQPAPSKPRFSKTVTAGLIDAVIADCEESLTHFTDEEKDVIDVSGLCYTIERIRSEPTIELQYAQARRWAECMLESENPKYVRTRMAKFAAPAPPSVPSISSKSFDATTRAALISAVIDDCEESLTRCAADERNLNFVLKKIRSAESDADRFEEAQRWANIILRNVHTPGAVHNNTWATTRIAKFATA